MRLTEYRTMLYLPQALYAQGLQAARRQKKSLSAVIREALQLYLHRYPVRHYHQALQAGIGLWKKRSSTGVQYENRIRAGWKHRG